MTHIGVTLSILRDPLEIVRLVGSGLENVKQLKHDGVRISFNTCFIFNQFVFRAIVIS